MKIKLATLIECFPGIKGTFNSIPKFARMQELLDSFSEIKGCVALYEEKRKDSIPAADKEGMITDVQQYEFQKKIGAMLSEEVDLKTPPKFTEKECEIALENRALVGSVYEAMRPYFIAKASPKETEDKK